MKTIVIAGASGFVGKNLTTYFEELGWKVLSIGRSTADATWNDQSSMLRVLEGADAVVNLAGKSVNCRFTSSNVSELIRSRVETTRAIGDAIALCKRPPAVWINASGASIYREQVKEANTEQSAIDGTGTMAEVARKWEDALYASALPHTRRIALRITLVLGEDGGVWPIYKRLARVGLGGRQGSGKQMMSWIHVQDLCRLVQHCIEDEKLSGAINAAAPGSISNTEFMSMVRSSVGVRFGWPASVAEISIGTALIGVPKELVLRGMWVTSAVLQSSSFRFLYPTVNQVK
jgi:uncharacterized protein